MKALYTQLAAEVRAHRMLKRGVISRAAFVQKWLMKET